MTWASTWCSRGSSRRSGGGKTSRLGCLPAATRRTWCARSPRPAGTECSPWGWPATRAGPWPSWTASTTCSSRRPPPCTGSRKPRPPSTTCCGSSPSAPWPPAGPAHDRAGAHMTGRGGSPPGRMLIAGVGNIFLGDDAFGPEVARRLATEDLPGWVRVADYGISGMHLAYDLADGYETAILIDAAPRGGEPGTVTLLDLTPPPRAPLAPTSPPRPTLDVEAERRDPATAAGALG